MERAIVMVQEFLRRRLNPFLLISTVVVLAILAGLSVTYQDVLSDKVSTNQQLRDTVEEKEARITALENETANLSSALELTRQDLAATVNETQRQEETIQDLEGEVSDLEGTVSDLESTIEEKNATIDDLRTTIDEKTTTVNNLLDLLDTICTETPDANMTADASDACDDWDDGDY